MNNKVTMIEHLFADKIVDINLSGEFPLNQTLRTIFTTQSHRKS